MVKVGLTAIATWLSYALIEGPGRRFLNQVKNLRKSYVFIVVSIVLFVPIGTEIRRLNYINADAKSVAEGGLKYPGKTLGRRIVLMGDSNGSMYGKVIKSICEESGDQLNVISVAAGDPLPGLPLGRSPLWEDSLKAVQSLRPDILVIACNWREKLRANRSRIDLAITELKPYVGRIVVVGQPPTLPNVASREEIRKGARPPFFEDLDTRRDRRGVNEFLRQKADSREIWFVDIAEEFELPDGSVQFSDRFGRQLYHDRTHLSGNGGEFVRSRLQIALKSK